MINKIIKINSKQANQRIDKFLASFCTKKSRAGWQKIIKNKEILIDKKIIKSDYILKENNELEILETKPLTKKIFKDNFPEIEIIYQDKDVIVINKPAGILSQPAPSSKSPSVSDFLIKSFPEIEDVGQDEQRNGVVHRLDKDTSGIMIIAKNNKSFKFFKSQFKNRKVQKTYLTLVYGEIKPKQGTINLKIGRSKTRPNMQTVIDTEKKKDIKAREAITIYKTIKTIKNYSLLEVQIKTGRMHQIRVHLKSLGFPVVGDKKYFFKKYRNIEPKLERQFLHAGELKIKLLDKKIHTFKTNLPKNLKNFLDKI